MMSTDLCFICHEVPTSENVELRRIARGMQERGHAISLLPLHHRQNGSQVIAAAIAQAPHVLHFHVRYPDNTLMDLALARYARELGYQGHITCSGSSAALDADWVLAHTAVDGVIPTNVDQTLHHMLSVPPESRLTLPGLQTRHGGPSFVPSPTVPAPWRPVRGARPTIHGVPIAGLAAVEGCAFRCAYCVHAAVAAQNQKHQKAAGGSPGHCPQQRRSVDDLADEMAELYHGSGVRYFHFTDDSTLPPREKEALAWIRDLKGHLQNRQIEDLSIGMNTRGDRMTPTLADALVNLGLIRTLMGVESGSGQGLAGIGRKGNAGQGVSGLQAMASRGVLVWFNSLFLHPESTVDSVRNELQFLAAVPNALFNTLKLRPFSGTTMTHRLEAAGLLEGGVHVRDYAMGTPGLNRFGSHLNRLQRDILGAYDPALRLHDLLLGATLVTKHGSPSHKRQSARTQEQLWQVAGNLNRTRVHILDQLLTCAEQHSDPQFAFALAAHEFTRLHARMNRMESGLEATTGSRGSHHYAHVAAAAVLAVTLSASSGCQNASRAWEDSDTIESTDSNEDTASDAGADSETGIPGDTGTSTDVITDTATETDSLDCGPNSWWDTDQMRFYDLLADQCGQMYPPGLQLQVDNDGKVVSMTYCGGGTDPVLMDCYLDVLQDDRFPCQVDFDQYCILAIE